MADLTLSMWLVYVLLVALAWAMPSFSRPTLPFGVRIPGSRVHEPVIARELRRYRWRIIVSAIVIAALAIGVEDATGWPESLVGALLALLVVQLLCYVSAHRSIMAVKHRERWYEGLRQGVVADTSLHENPPRYPWAWALPAVGVWLASLIIGIVVYPGLPGTLVTHYTVRGVANGWAPKSIGSAFSVVVVAAFCTVLIIGASMLAFRSRQELDVEHPAASARQHREFVRQMAVALLFLAACMNVTMLAVDLMIWNLIPPTGFAAFAGIMAPIIIGIIGVMVVAIRVGRTRYQAGDEEHEEDTGLVNRDDDRYWIAGMIYVNRDDPALLVGKRIGIGWTFNFGHPAAWVIMIVILALAFAPAFIPAFRGK